MTKMQQFFFVSLLFAGYQPVKTESSKNKAITEISLEIPIKGTYIVSVVKHIQKEIKSVKKREHILRECKPVSVFDSTTFSGKQID